MPPSNVKNDEKFIEVMALLDQRNATTSNPDLETKFYNAVLEFILSDNTDHFLCTTSMLPIAKESLWLFSLPGHDYIIAYKDKLDNLLKRCPNCVYHYYEAKKAMRKEYLKKFTRENVNTFFSFLEAFDLERIQTSLKNNSVPLNTQQLCALYEILYNPYYLQPCTKSLCTIFQQVEQAGVFPIIDITTISGICLLAFHEEKSFRVWARKLMEKYSSDDQSIDNKQLEAIMKKSFIYMTTKETKYTITVNRYGNLDDDDDDDDQEPTRIPLDELCEIKTIQEKDEIWKGLRSMMSVMTTSSLLTAVTSLEQDDTISMLDVLKIQLDKNVNNNNNNNSNIKKNKNNSIDVMKTFSYLWIRLQEDFWGKQTLENTNAATFYTIIKDFCESNGFRTHSKIAYDSAKTILARDGSAIPQDRLIHKIRSLVDWVFPFWYSLRLINDVETFTNHVLDTLLGYFQLDIWSSSFKACAVSGAFQVIENCINANKIPTEKINEYASKWVPFALMEENNSILPGLLAHIPSVAQSILSHLLCNDTQTLRDSFISVISSMNTITGDHNKVSSHHELEGIKISSYSKIWQVLESKSGKELAPISSALLSSFAPLASLDAYKEPKNETPQVWKQILAQCQLIHRLVSFNLEYVSGLPWENRESIVYDPLNAQPIMALLASPDLSIYISTYKLITKDNNDIRMNNLNNKTFMDSKHIQLFFDNEPAIVLRALVSILKNYMELSKANMDTYHIVLPYARTMSSFLHLLMGDEDSYLFQVLISMTLHSEDNEEQQQRLMKLIWDNAWKVMNDIFYRSRPWCDQYKPKEIIEKMLSWLDIANQIIGCRASFQKVVCHDTLDISSVISAVDGLSQWIFCNRTSILSKLVTLLDNILQYLQQLQIKISEDAYERLYNAAISINETRLEQHDKEKLFICLSGHEPINDVVYLDDSDDSDDDIQWQPVPMNDTTSFNAPSSSSSTTTTTSTSTSKMMSMPIEPNQNLVVPPASPSSTSSSPSASTTTSLTKVSMSSSNMKNRPKQLSISESFKNTPPSSDNDDKKKIYYSCRPNTKITTYFGNTIKLKPDASDMDIEMWNTNNVDNKEKDTTLVEKKQTVKSSTIPTPLDNIDFSTTSSSKATVVSPTLLGLEHMDIDASDSLVMTNTTPPPIINNIDPSAAISSLANKPSSRVYPNMPKSTTYAVTSTGRKLRAPSMGYSKIQQLREESKAERRLGATVKSPSAAAALKRKKRKSGSEDIDDTDEEDSNDDDDDEDDDDDDDSSGLLGLVESMNESSSKFPSHMQQHQQHGNVIIQEVTSTQSLFDTNQPRRSIKLIDIPGHSKKVFEKQKAIKRQERQRKQKRAPNIDHLYKTILSWSMENTSSSIPPHASMDMFNRIKDTYEGGFSEYVKYFEPLLLLEMWHQLIRCKEALSTTDVMHRFILESRCHVNDFVDVNFLVPINIDISGLGPDDLVCIANHFGPDFFSPTTTMIRGLAAATVAEREGHGWRGMAFLGKITAVAQRKNKGDVTVRCYFPADRITILNSLSPKSQWQVVKITSLSTVQREYAALYGLEHFDLVNDILNPRPTAMPKLPQEAVQKCIQTYNVNEPQAEAIVGALHKRKGFTLIQGPPGTGKTKTILGMIVTLLDQQKTQTKKGQGFPGKLLVCAPSNAAVDEIAKRLKEGIMTSDGLVRPKVVRIGVAESVNASVKDLLLERQVEKELEPTNGQDADKNKTFTARKDKVRESLRKIHLDIEQIDRDLSRTIDSMVMKRLYDKRGTLVQQRNRQNAIMKEIEEDYRDYSRDMDSSKQRVRQKIIGECDVVCATLSGSGHAILSDMGLVFDTVIVDEAAQAVEISSLIPLKYDCKRCILVGDPNQLPPTVISLMAAKYSYEQSLFVRLEKNTPNNVYLLSIQYRMHPQISSFPSKLFYQSRLKDGPGMEEKTVAAWHSNSFLRPYCFFNIKHGQERQGHGASLYNVAEAEAAVTLVDMLACKFPGLKLGYKIGIITPYKQQVSQLKFRFERRFGSKILQMIDFNTVDGFQGQEKDIIIFSCVRASSNSNNYGTAGIGFLSDIRRMNVGLTRAKKSLFVLGNARALKQDSYWGDLVNDARQRQLLINCDEPYFNYRIKYDFIPPNLFESDIVIEKRPIKERKSFNPIIVPYADENKEERKRKYNDDVNGNDYPMTEATTTELTTGKKHTRYNSKEEEKEENTVQREHSRRKLDHSSYDNKNIMVVDNETSLHSLSSSSSSTITNIPTSSSVTSTSKYKKAVPITPPSNNNHNTTTVKKPTLEEYNKIRAASKPKSSSLYIPKSRPQPSSRSYTSGSSRQLSSASTKHSSSSGISAKDRVRYEHQAQKDQMKEYRRQENLQQNRYQDKTSKPSYTPIGDILDSYNSK